MKLQLLLVLAVAALVPSLFESRIFSKCELKSILEKSISLHGQKNKHKEEYLAEIICHLNETSGLDSNLVTIEGIRAPRTTVTPSTLKPTNGTEGPKETTTTTASTTTTSTTTPTTATPTTTASADVSTSGPASSGSSTLSGSKKRRRRSSKKSKNTDTQKSRNSKESSEETFDVETRCDMQEIEEDDNCMKKRNRGSSENSEEDHQMTVWSLGKYGIFQLTDSHFCDSGYRWSRNVCKTNCSAFTDDNIQDDIKCFMDSKYLGCFLEEISDFCRAQANTYFNECN